MQTDNRTLQIISIQHELAMNIGLDLHLDTMLKAFCKRAQHRLSLSSVSIYYYNEANKENAYYYPKAKGRLHGKITSCAKIFFEQHQLTSQHLEHNLHHYYLLYIPNFGVLIFERLNKPISQVILAALYPLMNKLAASCHACLQHQSLLQEIDARKHAEELLIKQSLLDPLTGLGNRKLFNINLSQALSNCQRNNTLGAIFILDLDRFKVINDSFGHGIGDDVLTIVSRRLQKCTRDGDTLARVDGDEFVLLAVGLSPDRKIAMNSARKIAEKLSNLIAEPIQIEQNTFNISNSTGINLFPADDEQNLTKAQQCDELVKNADLALYRVKHTNRNGYSFFNKELQAFSEKRTQIEKCLRSAIEQNELSLNYQPLVDSQGQVIGAEALLRWFNQELGHVSPADFIPVAEESGLILRLGSWVIEQVCKLLQHLTASHGAATPKYISVNVSPRQFTHHDFVESLLSNLNQYEVDSQLFRIEITEGVAIENIDLTIQKMQKLKERGVVCMLDDFGCGYSSLSYLHQLPLQTIKVDRSFITNIDRSTNHRVVVDSIIDICEHFSLECVVEGVESSGEFNHLSAKKITAYQGYYFHRPMPENKFIELLPKQAKKPNKP